MSGYLAKVELLAELFRRDTGIMAPGKDSPVECGETHTHEQRRFAYDHWYKTIALDSTLAELARAREQLRRLEDCIEDASP